MENVVPDGDNQFTSIKRPVVTRTFTHSFGFCPGVGAVAHISRPGIGSQFGAPARRWSLSLFHSPSAPPGGTRGEEFGTPDSVPMGGMVPSET